MSLRLYRLLAWMLSYSLALLIVAYWIPQLWFSVQGSNERLVFPVLWVLLWIILVVVKKIISLLLLPFNIVTLWIFSFLISIVLNITLLYVFYALVQLYGYQRGIMISIGSLAQVIVLSFVLSFLHFVIRKVL